MNAGDPNEEDLRAIRTRKAEAPVLSVTMADGSTRRVWCTFGPQQIDINPFSAPGAAMTGCWQRCVGGKPCRNVGTIPMHVTHTTETLSSSDTHSCDPSGRRFVEESLASLCERGAKIVRLDAFGYATKKPGTRCFFEVGPLLAC